jgi:decaprenylphospho-beta-D-ribofuranose 2-oxidase
MVAAFEHYRENSDYMVGWIDHMSKGNDIGRGVFEAANHTPFAEGGTALSDFSTPAAAINVPCFLPPFVLNRYSMALYNKWRFKKYSAWRQQEVVDFNSFFHPLDKIDNWNRLYGRRGFFQYQCMFPDTPDVVKQMKKFLSAIHKEHLFSFLAVIKYHRDSIGFLTFPQRGYSIALDFPNTARVRRILPQLDQWVATNGGRVYLAKDALLTPDTFNLMYGQRAADWLHLINGIDPEGKFTSLMSQRLEWKKPHE